MAMLQRQRSESPVKAFSARLPEASYNALVEFALDKRFTLTAAVTYLLDKALNAEKGDPYELYTPDAGTCIPTEHTQKSFMTTPQ